MKPLVALSAVTLILAVSVNAQTNEASVKNDIANLNKQESVIKKEKKGEKKELRSFKGNEASYQAKQQFIKDFGDINVLSWERTSNYDKATFNKDGQTMSAYYDIDANLIGTTMEKTFADIPAKAQKFIDSKYGSYTKKAVIFFDDNELNESDMVLYNQPFEDEDNYFTELQKDNKEIIVKVNMNGDVSFFKELKY